MARTLRILTLNCQRAHRRENLHAYLWGLLKKRDLDFLLLQEVSAQVRRVIATIGPRRYGYALLNAEYPGMGEPAQVAILYRSDYAIDQAGFVPFSELRAKRNTTWGALFARFSVAARPTLVCVLHLDPGPHGVRRRVELGQVKQALCAHDASLKIVGGDFNFAFPGELAYATRLLRPEFTHATRYTTHSHDTSLVEAGYVGNKLLKRLEETTGIRFKSRIDHIFVASTAKQRYTTRVHAIVVSDHRPVELILEDAV